MIHEQLKIMNMTEILKTALRHFTEGTGIPAKLIPGKGNGSDNGVDAVVEIAVGEEKRRFLVQIKNEIRHPHIPGILEQMARQKGAYLLVAQYIPQPLKDELKKHGVNYLEASGNGFVHAGGLFYFVGGQAVTPVRQTPTGKLWNRTGLQFLFAILIDPEVLREPYRKMADRAEVALGNIGQLLDELKQAGYLKEGRPGLENKERLIQQWAELYPLVLRPKLAQGRFRFLRAEDRKQWGTITTNDFQWGGEPAGAVYTGFLEPEELTLYTRKPVVELVKHFRLVPDPEGDVQILNKFWTEKDTQPAPVVPPLLAYAELITSLDSRNRETAVRVKKQYLDD